MIWATHPATKKSVVSATTLSHEPQNPAQRTARKSRAVWVRRLRIGLPVGAGLLLLACAAQVIFRGLTAPAPQYEAAEASKMIAPRFAGAGSNGQTFLVTGREGMADQKDPGLILIDQPRLEITTQSRGVTTMTARTGVYNEAENKLLLKNDVQVASTNGSRFSSQQAVIDTRTGAVTGRSGLSAQTKSAQVQASDYRVLDEGDRMILRGGVRGRINPN
jgi:lipopolysaccharide export system protein LptC